MTLPSQMRTFTRVKCERCNGTGLLEVSSRTEWEHTCLNCARDIPLPEEMRRRYGLRPTT